MRDPALDVLETLRTPPYDTGRLLLTGWFSFLDGEVTVGDLMAQQRMSLALDQAGVAHDTAWSPGFRPGALTLEDAEPASYGRLLFVCGPAHGDQLLALHRRFERCRRLAVDVTVVDRRDPAVTSFDHVVARDGLPGGPRLDMSATAPLGRRPPVVGVLLTGGQGEYGTLRRHTDVNERLTGWVGQQDCARVEADTRLAIDDWRHCATAEQFMALAEKFDLVLTTRLHGMVLSLRAGTPVIAVDPVQGGAKVSAQARALRWPALVAAGAESPALLDRWWSWCLSPAGRAAAERRARLMHGRAARIGQEPRFGSRP
ncbi:polysaccharide pyruvyl transferase family protein [Streptomyces sp. NPDC051320]|uniref:polysaccharide pyruvyl transferase family protein n=1 Tax=Streptomyces sp. NPDC051320 TaxID=3154644 RepID=UPI003419676E